MHGLHGQYLRVTLSGAEVRAEVVPIPEATSRAVLGGAGLGAHLLITETVGTPDALDPATPVVFAFSPLVGSPLTTSAKFAVVGKSPLTNRLNDSLSSSRFAIDGKKTGHDALVLTGSADDWSVLIITDDHVRLRPAHDLVGLSPSETEGRLKAELGSHYSVASIGPAGERLVKYATISNDGRHAGRGGLGAVLGSKKLKAVAVTGSRRVTYADADELTRLAKDLSQRSFGPETAKYRELGTVSNLLTFNRLETLPTRNFQEGQFDGAASLDPERIAASQSRVRQSCAACTIGCEHLFPTADGDAIRLEYENLFALGPLCGIGDAETVLAASRFCDEAGLDTISAGASVAFAMECAERKLIDAPHLTFGSSSALLDTLKQIAARDGLGDLLGEGVRNASQQIGQGSEAFAAHVKGLELPGYEPRALQTMALGLAVNSRGADHNRSGGYQADLSGDVDRFTMSDASVRELIRHENEAALYDSLILCKFLRGVFAEPFAELPALLNPITGWNVDAAELRGVAERVVQLRRLYNESQGWSRAEDTLPERFLSEGLPHSRRGSVGLSRAELEAGVAAYYEQRGLTDAGRISDHERDSLSLS